MIYDSIDVSKPRLTRDGYLAAEAHVARTGIQMYRASELGLDGDPNRVVRVYRPPDEVFSADAMASYAHRPVTVDHPDRMVDATNWKELARGQTGAEVLRDKEFVRVPMLLMDSGAINEWKNGKRELSMGYEMTLDLTDGVTEDGEQYDAVQRNLRMNHLALVARARGGSKLKLGDVDQEDSIMSDAKLTTVTVDGLSVQTTDAGAQAIAKLSKELADARTEVENVKTEQTDAMKAKDKELAAKDAEIDSLKAKVLTAADLDKAVNDRADLISTAKSIADVDYTGKSVEDIRKTAVVSALGKDAIEGKSNDYIAARFDILAEDAGQDPVRKAVRSGPVKTGDRDKAYDGYVSSLQNAWKGNQKEVA